MQKQATILNTIKELQRFDFSDIEPYRDDQVRPILQNLSHDPSFQEVMSYVYPDLSIDQVNEQLSNVHTIDDFQSKVAYVVMRRIIDHTTDDISIDGLDLISRTKKHLFISNHRDIILDSALFNVLLFENGIETTETAIGDNLLTHPTVKALTKLNKNFTVSRDLAGRALYMASLKLSNYIKNTIVEGRSSIWISQREGRAKDGNDMTQPGLLKMLSLAELGNMEQTIEQLNILTLSISYEYDPCDLYKVSELIARMEDKPYVKAPDEDKQSIVKGITGKKGRVHFHVGPGPSITENQLDDEGNKLLQQVATGIDHSIYSGYKLWPNNYVALDLLNKEKKYLNINYTLDDKEEFLNYIYSVESSLRNINHALEILIQKYAYPLQNALKIA